MTGTVTLWFCVYLATFFACQTPSPKKEDPDEVKNNTRIEQAQQVNAQTKDEFPLTAFSRNSKGFMGAIQLAIGMDYSCALIQNGAVFCWGGNNNGQLGRGTRDNSRFPARVAGINDAIAIDAGMNHTCALHQTGQVSCWGNNHSAQLGDGSKEERLKPVSVLDLTQATQIALGSETSCALRKDGSVVCWGRNLEQRANISGSPNEHIPRPIKGLAQVKRLAVGSLHICAIQGNKDELVCVGLDHAINPSRGYQAQLSVESTGHTGVSDVAAGGGFTCFEKNNTWRCWGSNYRRQLGNSDGITVHAAKAIPIPGIKNISKIVAGDTGACAIDRMEVVRCWGYGNHRVHTVDGLKPVQEVAVSLAYYKNHLCARTKNGAVVCWGNNDSGQLGDGTITSRKKPALVLNAKSLDPVPNERAKAPKGKTFVAEKLAAGYDGTCALRSGEVWCWGTRHERIFSDIERYRRHPERVRGISEAVEIVAGFGFMCARVHSGRVWCWGENDEMQLGDGTDNKRLEPVAVRGVKDAMELVANYGRACVLRKNGIVTCWGNHESQHELRAATPWRRKIQSISLGTGHLCLLLKSSKVLCQGSNSSGQLGNGEGGCKPDPNDYSCNRPKSRCKRRQICDRSEEFVAVKGLDDVKSLTLGGGFSCALKQTGRMSCWGTNHFGELGIGPAQPGMVLAPKELKDLNKITQVVASSHHACARVSSGEVFCWGQNVFGEIGDRTTQRRLSPSAVFGIDDALEVSIGLSHGCARRNGDEVWCWGDNDDGVLGVGDEQRLHLTPKPVLEAPK